MRNIWRIIKADARSLFTHFFALAVALVIAVLPSLYAWLNIYSNWDPYGNTGNISIAVASLDKGWTEEDGTQVNKGREVVDDLRTSASINWVAVDTKEEAEHGVYAGDYYAAVVIGEDFSYNMYHMLTEWTGKPTITYYENYKKNAVATKITDTAVSSLKTTISKSYLDVVVDAVFRGANDLSDQLKGDDPVGSVQGLLGQARSLRPDRGRLSGRGPGQQQLSPGPVGPGGEYQPEPPRQPGASGHRGPAEPPGPRRPG